MNRVKFFDQIPCKLNKTNVVGYLEPLYYLEMTYLGKGKFMGKIHGIEDYCLTGSNIEVFNQLIKDANDYLENCVIQLMYNGGKPVTFAKFSWGECTIEWENNTTLILKVNYETEFAKGMHLWPTNIVDKKIVVNLRDNLDEVIDWILKNY